MNRVFLACLFAAAALTFTGCQTVKKIAKNWDNLSEFRLPDNSSVTEQGRMFGDGEYTLGAVTTQRQTDKLEPDFWTMFFHVLFEDSKDHRQSKFARYRVVDTISVNGAPSYELTAIYSISIDKNGNDSSEGVTSLSLRALPSRKKVDFQRTAQIGLERFLQGDVPQTVRVRYYFNDLDRTGGWADALRLPTGVAIRDSSGYTAILDLRYERHYYMANSTGDTTPQLVALLLATLVWDSDDVKKDFVEQTRKQ